MSVIEMLWKIRMELGSRVAQPHIRMGLDDVVVFSVWWKDTKRIFESRYAFRDRIVMAEDELLDTFIADAKRYDRSVRFGKDSI